MLRAFGLSFFVALFLGVSFKAHSFEVPSLSGPVMDEVGILSSSTKRQLEQSLYNLKQQQQVQLQVYITKSLQGEDIAGVAIQIFDKWKLGEEKTDKGLLFIIAPNEKRLRIEVGQGLEGDIPDVIAKRIISDIVRPYFQKSNFDQGVIQGVLALQTYIGHDDKELGSQVSQSEPQADHKGGGWIILIVIGIWLIIFMMNPSLALYILFSAMRGGRGGGGFGGGGGWSGGGGKSSGGGASGGW